MRGAPFRKILPSALVKNLQMFPSCASFAKTVCWEQVDCIHVSIDDCLCVSQTDFDGRRLELSYVQWYYSAWRPPQSRWNFRQLVFYSPCCTRKLYPWRSHMSSCLYSLDRWQKILMLLHARAKFYSYISLPFCENQQGIFYHGEGNSTVVSNRDF